jgi:hypothetical protein
LLLPISAERKDFVSVRNLDEILTENTIGSRDHQLSRGASPEVVVQAMRQPFLHTGMTANPLAFDDRDSRSQPCRKETCSFA